MHKQPFLTTILALLMILSMAACQKPIYGEQPEYGNLKFTTTPASEITLNKQGEIATSSVCNPGDSITVFMQVAYPGAYITEAKYTWKLQVSNDSTIENTIKVIAPHKLNTPPMWTFKAPEKGGKYAVSFKASYDYSAHLETGQIFGESTSHTAELNVRKY
jgi:hypothetical protein